MKLQDQEGVTQTNFFSNEEEKVIDDVDNEMIFGEINPDLWNQEVERNKFLFKDIKDPIDMSCIDVYLEKLVSST